MTGRRRGARRFAAALVGAAIGFAALGLWQIERRTEKLDLIERVAARIHAAPSPVPPPTEWAALDRPGAEYRRVVADGAFLPVRPAFVQAVTARGAGFWTMAPFREDGGFVLLVNRGFVLSEDRAAIALPSGRQHIVGLLRLTEPGGAFLRSNAPADDRWYSRDVAAIATARGLASVAPYFVDAEASAVPTAGEPEGGLTVVAFRNEHAIYAATWFALALLGLGGAFVVLRRPASV